MVCGIDVYHDKSQGMSCAAIVCSTDRNITRYYSEVVFQANRQEIIDKLRVSLTNAIQKYHSVSMCLWLDVDT